VKLRWDLVALAYGVLALAGGGLSALFNGPNPLLHPAPAFALSSLERHGSSCAAGVALALLVIGSTRVTVRRWGWARRLHDELRVVAVGMRTPTVVLVALLSSLGEEMLFRSLLTPLTGVWLQALGFGLLHQVRGPSRWVWVGWATLVGLALGAIYWATGSLLGAILAHALINAVNLAYLRDHAAKPPGPPPGGLLAADRAPDRKQG
jgi:hypothetical protein